MVAPNVSSFNPQAMLDLFKDTDFSQLVEGMTQAFSSFMGTATTTQEQSIFQNVTPQGPQPIYGFPNAGAALMPTHTLYNFGSGMYNLIAKYRSPVYRQPLSVTLGMMNNPYNTPFENNPLDWLLGTQYYQGGAPAGNPLGTTSGITGNNQASAPAPAQPQIAMPMPMPLPMPMLPGLTPPPPPQNQSAVNPLMYVPSEQIPSAPLGTPGLINQNYISPIGSSLAPLGYTNTLGEKLGFEHGSAFGDTTALLPGTNTGNAYLTNQVGSRTASYSPLVLLEKDDRDGVSGVDNLIGKYAKYLFNIDVNPVEALQQPQTAYPYVDEPFEEPAVQQQQIPKPAREPVKVESKPEPIPQPAPEPVKVEPKPEPIPQPAPEPVKVEPKPEPILLPAPEPVKVEPKPEPILLPAPEPVVAEPKPAPALQPAREPVKVEPKPEPIPQPAPEPVPEKPLAQIQIDTTEGMDLINNNLNKFSNGYLDQQTAVDFFKITQNDDGKYANFNSGYIQNQLNKVQAGDDPNKDKAVSIYQAMLDSNKNNDDIVTLDEFLSMMDANNNLKLS